MLCPRRLDIVFHYPFTARMLGTAGSGVSGETKSPLLRTLWQTPHGMIIMTSLPTPLLAAACLEEGGDRVAVGGGGWGGDRSISGTQRACCSLTPVLLLSSCNAPLLLLLLQGNAHLISAPPTRPPPTPSFPRTRQDSRTTCNLGAQHPTPMTAPHTSRNSFPRSNTRPAGRTSA